MRTQPEIECESDAQWCEINEKRVNKKCILKSTNNLKSVKEILQLALLLIFNSAFVLLRAYYTQQQRRADTLKVLVKKQTLSKKILMGHWSDFIFETFLHNNRKYSVL